MIFGSGRGAARGPSREDLERDAARILDERIAAGRPTPEVWRKAEERRDLRGKQGPGWYTSPTTASPSARQSGPRRAEPEAETGKAASAIVARAAPMELRVVQLTRTTARAPALK